MRHFVVLFLMFTNINIFSQSYTIDTIRVKSDILNEIRSIIVYKPLNISSTDPVKFIYFPDGESSNYKYQELYKHFKDSVSDLIAVGIINTDRRRDMLYINGADKFLDFIGLELIPEVEKDYKTTTRILNGHSFCGSFTVYALIHKPRYFDCYIASSPIPIMDLVKTEYYRQIDSAVNNKIKFCFSFGSKDMKQVRKWSLILKDNLEGMEFQNLECRFKIFEGKNHYNSDLVALFWGLDFVRQNKDNPVAGFTNTGSKPDYW